MRLLRLLLGWPFSFVWMCITDVRNFLYDRGIFKSTEFVIPVICVGNLSVGGTGKTPMINYLISFYLSQGRKIAVLSRGYGRLTKGFIVASTNSTAQTIGDESLLFYKRWNDKVVVAVGEKRVPALRSLRERYPDLDLILLDDGYQHRQIKASSYLLLTTYKSPFFSDFVIPAGSLRERRTWAKRADMVVVTKAPEILDEVLEDHYKKQINRYTAGSTFTEFCSFSYGKPKSFGAVGNWSQQVILVTGIANSEVLIDHLKKSGVNIVHHIEKADHYLYRPEDIEHVLAEYEKHNNCVIVTTEKDFVKLNDARFEDYLRKAIFFYIPVEFSFAIGKENFEAGLLKMLSIG